MPEQDRKLSGGQGATDGGIAPACADNAAEADRAEQEAIQGEVVQDGAQGGQTEPKQHTKRKPAKHYYGTADTNPQHIDYINALVHNGGHGTNAAIAAGYSPRSAHVASSRLRKNARINQRIRENIEASRLTFDEAVGNLIDIIRLRPDDCADDEGEFSVKVARANGAEALIKNVKQTINTIILPDGTQRKTVNQSFEFYSRLDALRLAGDFMGWKQSERRNEHNEAEDFAFIQRQLREFMDKVPQLTAQQALALLQERHPEYTALQRFRLPEGETIDGELVE